MLRAQDIYDTVPVHFCKKCLSLRILRLEGLGDPTACYCDVCGNTDIGETSIYKWETLYQAKYKKPFINIKKQY